MSAVYEWMLQIFTHTKFTGRLEHTYLNNVIKVGGFQIQL